MPTDTRHPTRRKQFLFLATLALAACLVGLLTLYKLSVANAYRIFVVEATPIAMPNDEATQSRGEHLLGHVVACRSCHGADLSGRVLQDDKLAVISAPNLTTPRTDSQWLRALRYGVDEDGRGLWRMPTRAHSALRDHDLAAVVATIRAAAPVHHTLPQTHLRWRGNVAVAARRLRLVRTDQTRTQATFAADSPQGAYLYAIANCAACHGGPGTTPENNSARQKWALGAVPVGDLDSFSARLAHSHRHLTQDAPVQKQSQAALPADRFAGLTNLEVTALWSYLKSW